jgi:predicted methyltransferase
MSTLVLELPDKHIQVLERVAHERGTSVDEIVAELVDTIAAHEHLDTTYDVTRDPLYTIKAHESSAPADLSRNVDQYLYGATRQ